MRHADHERVQRDRHHPARMCAFTVQHVEVALEHVGVVVGLVTAPAERALVMGLLPERQRYHAPAVPLFHIEEERLVVVEPVRRVGDPFLGQMLEGLRRLRHRRAKPAGGPAPGRMGNGIEGGADHGTLGVRLDLVQRTRVALAVANHAPAKVEHALDDARMVVADLGVERGGTRHAETIEHVHHAEHTDAIPVVGARPARHVWDVARRLRYRLVVREELEVHVDPHRDARAVRPGQRWPVDDRRIGKRPIGPDLHSALPVFNQPVGRSCVDNGTVRSAPLQ